METIYDLDYDKMSNANILEIVDYLNKNISHFDIVAKQITEDKNYLEDANEARELLQELKNAYKGGSDCGISGFIYYADTTKFYSDNFYSVESFMEEMAQEQGYNSALELLSNDRSVNLGNIEDVCVKYILENVAYQTMEAETSDLDLSQEDDNKNYIKLEIVLQELIDNGCKFAVEYDDGTDQIETNDAKEVLNHFTPRDCVSLDVYKDSEYVGSLDLNFNTPEIITNYDLKLNNLSATLFKFETELNNNDHSKDADDTTNKTTIRRHR